MNSAAGTENPVETGWVATKRIRGWCVLYLFSRRKEILWHFGVSYAHLVWATKNREPLIQANIKGDIYAYMVRKAAELGC